MLPIHGKMVIRPSYRQTLSKEIISAFLYIFLVGIFLWVPFVYLFTDLDPLSLFQHIKGLTAALMFYCGAVIANATAVGGGIVFNPMLQLIFGVSGFSALALAITVQCAGMTSGTYGWYQKGEYRKIHPRHLFLIALCTVGSTAASTLIFFACKRLFPTNLLLVMKIASALVSFYVFLLLWKEIKQEKLSKHHRENEILRASGIAQGKPQAGSLPGKEGEQRILRVDWRIYPWIALGTLLNVHTAVGVGELIFSHLIKYYRAPAKRAVAVGAMMQALSVWTQTVFNILYLREYLLIDLVCIGLLFTMVGGRMAPLIMTHRVIEPYVKHILAFTAFAMGMTSVIMPLIR